MNFLDYAMALCLLAVVCCGPPAIVLGAVRVWKYARRTLNKLDFLRAEARWWRNHAPR